MCAKIFLSLAYGGFEFCGRQRRKIRDFGTCPVLSWPGLSYFVGINYEMPYPFPFPYSSWYELVLNSCMSLRWVSTFSFFGFCGFD